MENDATLQHYLFIPLETTSVSRVGIVRGVGVRLVNVLRHLFLLAGVTFLLYPQGRGEGGGCTRPTRPARDAWGDGGGARDNQCKTAD